MGVEVRLCLIACADKKEFCRYSKVEVFKMFDCLVGYAHKLQLKIKKKKII